MRNPERLHGFYNEFKRIHMQHFPDWRSGQLMYNFMMWLDGKKQIDIFFPEENELIKLFKEFAGEEVD